MKAQHFFMGMLFTTTILGEARLLSPADTIQSASQSRLVQEQSRTPSIFDVSGFVDSESCWKNLISSDSDVNGVVDRQEFVQFAKLENIGGDKTIEAVTTFLELPLAYQLAYFTTSCLCNDPNYGGDKSNTTCCLQENAVIRVPGSEVSQLNPLSETDQKYLYAACVLTNAASETVESTPSPNIAPSPVNEPSSAPSISPSSAQSLLPSNEPSLFSSNSPTLSPKTSIKTNATVVYQISIRNGTGLMTSKIFRTEYLSNLQLAMNRLVTDISNESLNDRRRLQNGNNHVHQLRITGRTMQSRTTFLELPTEFLNIQNISCPSGPLVSIWSGEEDASVPITLDTIDLCQEITSIIHLTSDASPPDFQEIASQFENDLYNSIYDGEYQKELDSLYASDVDNTENPIIVLTGYRAVTSSTNPPTATTVVPNNDSFSPGTIAGITLGAVVAILLPIAMFFSRRNHRDIEDLMKKPDYQEYEPDSDDPADLVMRSATRYPELQLPTETASVAGSQQTDFAVKSTGSVVGVVGATALGAAPFDFHNKGSSKKIVEAALLEEGEDIVAEPGVDNDKDDSSSNAGSSGWSSSAGISSLNTGSIDDSSDIAAAAGATLAGIGLASGSFRQQQRGATSTNNRSSGFNAEATSGEDDDSIDNSNANIASSKLQNFGIGESSDDTSIIRDQLDSLIESGDWAAVGATAALLAAASDSQSAATRSSKNSRSAVSEGNSALSVDAARAAELDHLVDSGDWEGVVLAAAKFEAAAGVGFVAESQVADGNGSRDGRSRANSSSQDSSVDDSATGTGTFTGTFDPSISTSLSDDPSRAARLAEYRSEVEALVKRVVPEEIDNVDEMMNQFKGREDELVETLRTMQERAAAQKARQVGQKHAKLEARRTVQRGVVPGAHAIVQRSDATDSSKPDPIMTRKVDGAEGGNVVATSFLTGTSSGAYMSLSNAPREEANVHLETKTTALDQAIKANNWHAAGEAAATMSGSSATTMSANEVNRLANENYSTTTTEGSENSRKRHLAGVNADRAAELDAIIDKGDWNAVVSIANRFTEEDSSSNMSGAVAASTRKISQEEEVALREAELWMKIAEQTKAEGANDAGASDAAEWAIQRSLSQLRDAEKKNNVRGSSSYRRHGDDEDEV